MIRTTVLWALRHRFVVLGVVAACTALAVASIARADLSSDLLSLFLEEGPSVDAWRAYERDFGEKEAILLAWPEADPYGAGTRKRIAAAAAEIRTWPSIHGVLSLGSLKRITTDGAQLIVETWGDALDRAPTGEQQAAVLKEILELPETRKLASSRGDTATLAVFVKGFGRLPSDEQVAFEHKLRDVVWAQGLAVDAPIHAVGFPVVIGLTVEASLQNLRVLIPLHVLVALAFFILLYRGLWPAGIAVAIGSLASSWALGLALTGSPKLTVVHTGAPMVILVLALADIVFVVNAFLERVQTEGRAGAIEAALEKVGPACALTTATTALGFASLGFVPTPAVRTMGLICGVGALAALGLLFTLLPVLLSLVPTARLVRSAEGSYRLTGGLTRALTDVALRWPGATAATGTALVVGLALTLPGLTIDAEWSRRFEDGHRLSQAQAFVLEHLSGTTDLEVIVRPSERSLTPPLLQALAAFQERAAARPEVTASLSVVNVLEKAQRSLTGGQDRVDAVGSVEQAEQLLFLVEAGAPTATELVVTPRRDALLVHIDARPTGLRDVAGLAEGLAADLRQELTARHVQADVEVTGLGPLLGSYLDTLVAGQLRSLFVLSLLTALLIALAFRSIRLGLTALPSNALPLLGLFASFAVLGSPMDSDYVIVAIVGLSLVVDGTIHYVARFQAWVQAGQPAPEAIRRASEEAGPAMVQTTLILVVGFSPDLLSDYTGTKMFFTQLPKILVVGLFADLVYLPALLLLVGGRSATVAGQEA